MNKDWNRYKAVRKKEELHLVDCEEVKKCMLQQLIEVQKLDTDLKNLVAAIGRSDRLFKVREAELSKKLGTLAEVQTEHHRFIWKVKWGVIVAVPTALITAALFLVGLEGVLREVLKAALP